MVAAASLALPVRAVVAVAVAGGIAATAAAVPDAVSWDASALGAALAIAVAIVVLDQLTLALPHGDGTIEYFSATDAVWVAALLLAPSSVLVLGAAAGTAVGQAARRWTPYKVAFNVGQVVIGLTAASAIYRGLGAPRVTEPRAWAVATLAMGVCFLVNAGAVALVISLVRGVPFPRIFLAPMRVNLLQWAGNVALGVLAALVWTASPAGVLFLVVPLSLLYLAYRGWLRSLRERDQMREMAETADGIAREGDLGRRLPAGPGEEPLAALAGTLNRMLERLEAAFLRERRFIREASHELRTPITISRGHLEVLAPQPHPLELEETVGLVLDELDRMGRILGDMTTIARAEQPGWVRPTDVRLEALLADVATKATPLLNGRLQTRLPTEGAVVRGDPQRLTQAFLNLLQNASVHTAEGPVELRAVAEPSCWRVEVVDSGRGVPAGEEEAIFQPFYQVSGTRRGSGLGLALVRTIAEAHGGSAGVENEPGAGATFWVRLPR